MVYRTQYFKYLRRHSCLSLRIHHGEAARSHRIVLIKSKGRKVLLEANKELIPIENMNVEKLGSTKSNPNMFSQVSLKCIQKSASLRCSLPPTPMLFCYKDFCKLLIITKDSFIGN